MPLPLENFISVDEKLMPIVNKASKEKIQKHMVRNISIRDC